MASKRITYTGGNLVDTGSEYFGWSINNTSGLFFSSSTVSEESIPAYSSLTHRATETTNPLWNQVAYNITTDVVSSDLYSGRVTLSGLADDGTFTKIMEHIYEDTLSTTGTLRGFDLLGSSCTNAQTSKIIDGTTAGSIKVQLPLSYQNYEEVDITAAWIDPAWTKRKAITFEKSGGQLHGTDGHYADYYVYPLYITYDADMKADFSDIRFTTNDGLTTCSYYLLRKTDSTSATFLVAVPSFMVDINKQEIIAGSTGYATNDMSYIYCYYGNAAASSISDVTLNGNMMFYDDFDDGSIDAVKWPTVTVPANTSITETGGYLQLQVNGGVTATPTVISSSIGDTFATDDTIEYVFDITAMVPLSGTTATNGAIVRMYTGASDYFEVRMMYSATGFGGSTTAGYYAAFQASKGGVSTGVYYTYYLGTGTITQRYIKLKLENINTTSGAMTPGYGPRVTSYHSFDGASWDFIGSELQSTGPTTGDMKVALYYVGQSGVATSKYVRFNGVYVYRSYGSNYDYVEDYFNNAEARDRWSSYTSARATVSESAGSLTLAGGTGGGHNWTGSSWDCPTIYVSHKRGGWGANEICVYQTEVTSMTEAATYIGRAGIHIFNGTTVATMEHIEYSIAKNGSTGVYTLYALRQTNGVQTEIMSVALGNTTVVTLPCHIRIMVDPTGGIVYFDYSTDSINWKRAMQSFQAYTDASLTTGAYMGLAWLDNSAQVGNGVFSYFKSGTMGQEAFEEARWSGEESLATYPILPVTPAETDTTMTFTTPANMIRNNALYLRVKDFGAGYNNSKIVYLSDRDVISIGPDGTDKYIGMKIEFDFKFAYTDTFDISGISYIYEVI